MTGLDPAAIMAEHEPHTAHPGSFTRCASGFPGAGPCLPYRLAAALTVAKADGWDEGWEGSEHYAKTDNPYRAGEGAAE
jgi:hypothetical protein